MKIITISREFGSGGRELGKRLAQTLCIDGIWISIVVAEIAAAVMTFLFIFAKRGKYHYI